MGEWLVMDPKKTQFTQSFAEIPGRMLQKMGCKTKHAVGVMTEKKKKQKYFKVHANRGYIDKREKVRRQSNKCILCNSFGQEEDAC